MNEEKLISIIVPVYNVDMYLDTCINSIVNQTYKNLEIILIDDGSQDECPIICDNWLKKDNRIRVVHQENHGPFIARINGIKISKGDWIGFVDGDDFIDSNMFEILINNALDNNADISQCTHKLIINNEIDHIHNYSQLKLSFNKTMALNCLLIGKDITPFLWDKLYRKKLFDNVLSSLNCSIKIAHYEDLLLNYFVFKEIESINVNNIALYNYVMRTNSLSHISDNYYDFRDMISVTYCIENDCLNNEYIKSIKKRRLGLLFNMILCDSKTKSCLKSMRKYAIKNIRNEFKEYLFVCDKLFFKLKLYFILFFPITYKIIHKIYKTIKYK